MTSAALPLVNASALPEHQRYKDEGCDLAPSCLRCPFPRCRFDAAPGGIRRLQTDARRRAVCELRDRGYDVSQIASVMKIARRSVFRLMADVAA